MNVIEENRNARLDGKKAAKEKKEPMLFEEEIVSFVQEEANRRKTERLTFELQWQLNANFQMGNQHCDINVKRNCVENYSPLYDYMSAEVFNRIAPIMETRLSHLREVDYGVVVLPKSDEYDDLHKARVATALLRNRMRTDEYKSAFSRAMGLCEQTGNAFILSWWDGKKENGADVAYTVLTPYEVLPDNLYEESVEGQASIILAQVKSPAEIEALYGKKVEGGSVDTFGMLQRNGAGGLGYRSATMSFAPVKRGNAVELLTYMEKPNAKYPSGRLYITAGGELLYAGDLPYGIYPLCQMKSEQVTGQFFGKSVIETLIPYQRSYNGIKNRINDFVNRSTCGQLLIEEGSVDVDDLTDKGLVPGEPVLYQRGSAVPKLLDEPQLSDIAMAECTQLSNDMEYAAGVSGLMISGALPGGVTSGTAIERLQKIDTTRLSVYADNIRAGVLRLAYIWLAIYRKYLTQARAIALAGENEKGAVMLFTGTDLNSDELAFETENELKVYAETQRERFIEVLRLGLLNGEDGRLSRRTKELAAKRLLGKNERFYTASDLQMKNACAENAAFERGEKLAVKALDDHLLHLEEHRLYALQQSFGSLMKNDPEKCKPMLEHIEAHRAALAKENTEKETEE